MTRKLQHRGKQKENESNNALTDCFQRKRGELKCAYSLGHSQAIRTNCNLKTNVFSECYSNHATTMMAKVSAELPRYRLMMGG